MQIAHKPLDTYGCIWSTTLVSPPADRPMQLDLRPPTFVVNGAWNPAIFQPFWVASHLFDIPPGEEVELVELMALIAPGQQRRINYIRGVGIAVQRSRLELFVNAVDADTKANAERVFSKLFETLPHTPFGSFGVNFQFRQPDPADETIDQLKCTDRIDQHFLIKEQSFRATIELRKRSTSI